MNTLISVVVCTYNRAAILFDCLKSLCEQIDAGINYEVLVVNNSCSDNTSEVVENFARQYAFVKEIIEPIQGLSYARNCGINEASGEYVAYIDDDVMVSSDWIYKMAEFIKRHPEISAFGGPSEVFAKVPIPDWFPPKYGSLDYGLTERPLVHNKEWIDGSNMIFKKELLLQYGGFNERLGMSGHRISYGEDTLLIQRLMDSGVIVFYVPTIKVMHLLPEYKMHLKWLLMARYSSGLNYETTFNKRLTFIDYIAIILKSLFRMVRCLLPPCRKPFKRKIYYVFADLFFGYGTLCEKSYGQKKHASCNNNK